MLINLLITSIQLTKLQIKSFTKIKNIKNSITMMSDDEEQIEDSIFIFYIDGDEEIVEYKNCLTVTVRGETYGELADKIAGLK